MATALVAVVNGEAYERHARAMFNSAFEWFRPEPAVAHIMLPGRAGWPDATLYRYHTLLEHDHMIGGFEHVFMIDADMRFEAPVGGEILAGITATAHPGYVGKRKNQLPFENRPESTACASGRTYYCGGFIGGRMIEFMAMARTIVGAIDADTRNGIVARWHDESHLNAYLSGRAPHVLPPSYCYPDDDSAYVTWWPKPYERILVAIDKPHEERAGR